jgi:hypothetical protein
MTTVEKLGGNWVIVRDGRVNAPDEAGDSLTPQDRDSSANREFWTGDGWAGQYGLAKLFATKEETEAYLAEHRHEMA